MRLFVAIEIPGDIREGIIDIEQKLSPFFRSRWVGVDNIHLTLIFLGEIDDNRLDRVKEIVSETARFAAGFSLSLENIGGFPNLKRPRVIWIGVREGNGAVIKIMQELEEKFTRFGLKPEMKKKTPHITIGRVKEHLMSQIGKEDLERLTYKSRAFRVECISLIKSDLTPKGAIYSVMESYPLKG